MMADEPTEIRKPREDATTAARLVLAKHPTVIPSRDPYRRPEPVAPGPVPSGPVDVGVRNILRSLAK